MSELTILQMREPREAPDDKAIRDMVTRAVTDASGHWQRISAAQAILLCDREGRDGTGQTGTDANNRRRGPWLNSADTDVALAAEALKEVCDRVRKAVKDGAISALPQEPEDAIAAGLVQQEMMWWLNGPCLDNFTSVAAQAVKWTLGFGSYVVGLDWLRRENARDGELVLADLWQWAVAQATQDFTAGITEALQGGAEITPEQAALLEQHLQGLADEAGAALAATIWEKSRAGELAEIVSMYAAQTGLPMSEVEALRVARALQAGQTEVEYCGYETVEDRPALRGLRPGVDVLFPCQTTDLASAEWVVEPLWGTARQVREWGRQYGWDEKWTEELLKNPGASHGLWPEYGARYQWLLSGTTVNRVIPYEAQDDWFCPLLFTYRGASRAGVGCIYQCVLHDRVVGFAMHERLDTVDGRMPYADFRSDMTEPVLMESRGLICDLESYQTQAKANMDAFFDAISVAINPEVVVSGSMAQCDVRGMLGPGKVLNVTRGQMQFMERNNISALGLGAVFDDRIRILVARRFGLRHKDVDPELSLTSWQVEAGDFLHSLSLVLGRVWGLIQLYGPAEIRARVVAAPAILGSTVQTQAQESLQRAEIRGGFDFHIDCDVRSQVLEWVELMAKVLGAVKQLDLENAIPTTPVVQAMMGLVHPRLAAQVRTSEQAQDAQVARTQADLATIVTGQEPPWTPGQNSALALQLAQETVQKSPLFQQYLQNEQVRAVFENWAKQHEQAVKQEQNKQIGRTGGRPVLQLNTGGNGS